MVTTAGADGVNALSTDTGVGGLATQLEGSLLPCSLCVRNCFISFMCDNRLRTHGVGSTRMGCFSLSLSLKSPD